MCERPFTKYVVLRQTPSNCGIPNFCGRTMPKIISNNAAVLKRRYWVSERLMPCKAPTPLSSSMACKAYAGGKSQSHRDDLGFNVMGITSLWKRVAILGFGLPVFDGGSR